MLANLTRLNRMRFQSRKYLWKQPVLLSIGVDTAEIVPPSHRPSPRPRSYQRSEDLVSIRESPNGDEGRDERSASLRVCADTVPTMMGSVHFHLCLF